MLTWAHQREVTMARVTPPGLSLLPPPWNENNGPSSSLGSHLTLPLSSWGPWANPFSTLRLRNLPRFLSYERECKGWAIHEVPCGGQCLAFLTFICIQPVCFPDCHDMFRSTVFQWLKVTLVWGSWLDPALPFPSTVTLTRSTAPVFSSFLL